MKFSSKLQCIILQASGHRVVSHFSNEVAQSGNAPIVHYAVTPYAVIHACIFPYLIYLCFANVRDVRPLIVLCKADSSGDH